MSWEAWVTLATVGAILFALARNYASPDVILMGGLTVLMTLGVASDRFPSPGQLAGAFGNEGLLTVGILFVVAAGLTETGGMAMAIDRILGRPRSTRDAQLRMMLPVATLSTIRSSSLERIRPLSTTALLFWSCMIQTKSPLLANSGERQSIARM